MAIRMNLQKTERILFCGSKWWGDPDMPENMQYPTVEDYPLTFICQINCEDIAPFDKTGRLPHEGMLYFFGAIDGYLGYGSPVENGAGEWPKGHFVVKYAKSINFETFQSCILVDEDDQPLTEPELEITFEECADDSAGHLLLNGTGLLRIVSDEKIGLLFDDGAVLDVMMTESDLKFGNWKRAKAVLH